MGEEGPLGSVLCLGKQWVKSDLSCLLSCLSVFLLQQALSAPWHLSAAVVPAVQAAQPWRTWSLWPVDIFS